MKTIFITVFMGGERNVHQGAQKQRRDAQLTCQKVPAPAE